VDLDVASYYPNLAIANDIYPEHLSSDFCTIYRELYERRKSYAKGTPENAMLKLALNGAYGNSNNKFSPLYDPQYTMAITVNGQLLLCMLAEKMIHIPDLKMIQANTDGITVKVPRKHKWLVDMASEWWQDFTGLVLEEAIYDVMYILNVNNYLAVYEGGKVKRKGSMEFIMRVKVSRSDQVVDEFGWMYDRIGRCFISTNGVTLTKVSPPKGELGAYKRATGVSEDVYNQHDPFTWKEGIHTKNKSKYEERRTELFKGRKATMCNHIGEFDWTKVDWDFYESEVWKLVTPLNP